MLFMGRHRYSAMHPFSSQLNGLLICFTWCSFIDIFAGQVPLRATVIAQGQVVLWMQTLPLIIVSSYSPLQLFKAHQFSSISRYPVFDQDPTSHL
jgi:hypothetical protein